MNSKSTDLGVTLLFVVILTIGIYVHKSFGISWDETISRLNGLHTFNFIINQDQSLLTYKDRYYGTVFETFLVFIEKVSHLTSSSSIIYQRHLLTFLFNFSGWLILYFVSRNLFKNPLISLVPALLLITSPRLFAESFYNSKDLVFTTSVIYIYWSLFNVHKKPALKTIVASALATAFATGIRIVGIIFIPLFLISLIINKKYKLLAIYPLLVLLFLYAIWPILWVSPLSQLIEAVKSMSNFTPFNNQVLYFGQSFYPNELPWHYLPVWIGITTPIFTLILFVLGLFLLLKMHRHNFYWLSIIYWSIFPLFYTIIATPRIYDGWRHFYFIFPAICLISGFGFSISYNHFKKISIFILLVSIIATTNFTARNFPNSHVYFNGLIGGISGAAGKFDLDYWGLSFNSGLRYILNQDNSEKIPIFLAYGSTSQLDILDLHNQNRFEIVNHPTAAKYLLTNYRWQDYHILKMIPSLYSVYVDATPIMSVYKINQKKPGQN